MILDQVGLLVIDSMRTRAYLHALAEHDLQPGHAIYMTGGPGSGHTTYPSVAYFDCSIPALDKIRAMGIPCEVVDTGDVNDPEVVSTVHASPVEVLIYSGPAGAILRRDLLSSGKRFLHLHPGLVPRFRGSTTVYYSLLIDESCGVSAMFLEEEIDKGPVLATRSYPPPADRTSIDHEYDPCIRSDLLVEVLRDYAATGEFRTQPQETGRGETYYIMHPVLRHIAILSKR